ncbi:helix-turn-helix domain-containing protein [Actinomadura citrea]|uniref:helix-turn-helix domain-containing protein n=1 Tax=Actinomadura citrea TaxID=46158 RepID=UPI003CE5113D
MTANPLSAQLRELREAARLSGAEAARRTGLSQSKVSRAETGKFLLKESELRALCELYGVPPDRIQELVAMRQELAQNSTSARAVLQRGTWWMQERIGRMETASQRIRSFAPAAVIGLLQSPAYIAALYGDSLSPDEIGKAVDARIKRQHILNSDREFVFLMAEGALRWNMGGAHTMVEQLEYLAEASTRPNVRIGVIPQTTATTVPALHTYTLYDSTAVLIGTWTATATITDPRDVQDYEDYWSELEPFASWGDEARAVMHQVAEDYRAMS